MYLSNGHWEFVKELGDRAACKTLVVHFNFTGGRFPPGNSYVYGALLYFDGYPARGSEWNGGGGGAIVMLMQTCTFNQAFSLIYYGDWEDRGL